MLKGLGCLSHGSGPGAPLQNTGISQLSEMGSGKQSLKSNGQRTSVGDVRSTISTSLLWSPVKGCVHAHVQRKNYWSIGMTLLAGKDARAMHHRQQTHPGPSGICLYFAQLLCLQYQVVNKTVKQRAPLTE